MELIGHIPKVLLGMCQKFRFSVLVLSLLTLQKKMPARMFSTNTLPKMVLQGNSYSVLETQFSK